MRRKGIHSWARSSLITVSERLPGMSTIMNQLGAYETRWSRRWRWIDCANSSACTGVSVFNFLTLRKISIVGERESGKCEKEGVRRANAGVTMLRLDVTHCDQLMQVGPTDHGEDLRWRYGFTLFPDFLQNKEQLVRYIPIRSFRSGSSISDSFASVYRHQRQHPGN